MRIGRISRTGLDGPEPRLVVARADDEAAAVDVRAAAADMFRREGADTGTARQLAKALFPGSLTTVLGGGGFVLDALKRAVADADDNSTVSLTGVTWLSPVDPPVMRDFMSFEQHLVTGFGRMGREVPQAVYELPVYYKANGTALIGHEAEVPWPGYTDSMDYELELGFVVGAAGQDLTPGEARPHLFGVTAYNDFSARDIQGQEMGGGLGPAKGKDFATALGPWVVTLDEVDPADLSMVARVNGEEWSRGVSGSAMWSVDELLAWASAGERLNPGDLIGSGTLGGGCGLELGRKLSPGDSVELEVTGVGVLRNRLGAPAQQRWLPQRRTPDASLRRQ